MSMRTEKISVVEENALISKIDILIVLVLQIVKQKYQLPFISCTLNYQTPDFSKELSIYSTIYILGALKIMDRSNITSAVQSKPRVLNENFENAAFTSELCQFLTNLAKTPGDEYSDLALDLSRLREALLNEVETESNSISDTRGNTSESEGKITKTSLKSLQQ